MTRLAAERALTFGLLQLNRHYRQAMDRALSPLGLSDAKAVPLLYMARGAEGVRQGVAAEALGLEGPSLVRLLDQLCAAQLVERRQDPNDARAKTLHLTEAGRDLAARCEAVLDEVRATFLAEVSDADLATTLQVLGRLETAILAAASPRLGRV